MTSSQNIVKKGLTDQLGVLDAKLGALIKEKLGIQCQFDSKVGGWSGVRVVHSLARRCPRGRQRRRVSTSGARDTRGAKRNEACDRGSTPGALRRVLACCSALALTCRSAFCRAATLAVAGRQVFDLTRGVRAHQDSLLTSLPQEDMKAIQLGLAHSLSRYKLKFSPDKVRVACAGGGEGEHSVVCDAAPALESSAPRHARDANDAEPPSSERGRV